VRRYATSAFRARERRPRYGAIDAEYITSRALITNAVPTTTAKGASRPSRSIAASCEAPANTTVDSPSACATVSSASTAAAPATSPNGAAPNNTGAIARTPARKESRPDTFPTRRVGGE
jgi:hypothetical protein